MGNLNVRLRYPCDERDEDLATTLADRGMVGMADHFVLRRRYSVVGSCTWFMKH